MTVDILERSEADAPAAANVHRIEIEVSHVTSGRTMYRVTYRGTELAVAGDPEHAACRALLAMGVTGSLRTRWKSAAHDAMALDIERGAGRRTSEGEGGLSLKPFVEFPGRAVVGD